METSHCELYIDGAWCPASSGRTYTNTNPAAPSQVLSHHPKATADDVNAAVEAAAAAFPAWRDTPAPARGRILAKAAALMFERVDELARGLSLEEGKNFSEARGEVLKGLNILEYMAGEGWRLHGETLPSEMKRTFTYTLRQPLGPVAIITPWNFPFAIPVWKIAPALVAGNTVVFKPATWTPLTATRIVQIFEQAGLPKGVLNLVTGSGGEVGDTLVNHSKIRAISFTGSTEVGRHINEMAARRLVKITCEMGGKNPVIVLDDADVELAVEGVFQGAFGSTGQRCTATSRVILTPGIRAAFLEKLAAKVRGIKIGPGVDSTTHMGPSVSAHQQKIVLEAIHTAEREGAKVLARADVDPALGEGYWVPAVVFTGVEAHSTLAQEEVFGPVLAVQDARDADHALELANNTRFGLSSSLYASDIRNIQKYIEQSEVGMVHVNSPTVGGEAQLPFGGIKETGVGDREMGHWGVEFFTEIKTVFLDWTGTVRRTNIY